MLLVKSDSVLAFYIDDLNSDPTDAYSFFCKICVWNDWKNKKRGPDHIMDLWSCEATNCNTLILIFSI